MLVVGGRVLPWLLDLVVATGSASCLLLRPFATAIGRFRLGRAVRRLFALGAFFAGMVVNASDHSERAAQELPPLQDAFTVLFFVAAGMLFNPAILIEQPAHVLATAAVSATKTF